MNAQELLAVSNLLRELAVTVGQLEQSRNEVGLSLNEVCAKLHRIRSRKRK